MAAVTVEPVSNGGIAVLVCRSCGRGLEAGLSDLATAVTGMLDHAADCEQPVSELGRRLAVVRSSGSAA